MELMHPTHTTPREPLAMRGDGASAPRRRGAGRWWSWVAGAVMVGAVGLAAPPPASACWYCGIVNGVENIGHFFKDLATDLAGLTEAVVTVDPAGAFHNLIDVFQDVVCP